MPTNSRPLHALKFLGIHFGQTLRVRFFLDSYPVRAEEIFDQYLALTPIARAANQASRLIFGTSFIDSDVPCKDSAFGHLVTLSPKLSSLDLSLLIAAAEDFFGITSTEHTDAPIDIDLRDIINQRGASA